MELEVEEDDDEEEEYIDEDDETIVDGGVGENLKETNLEDEHMDETEEDNIQIDSHPGQHECRSENEDENDMVEDIPHLDNHDFAKDWCKNLRGFPQKPDFVATPGLQGPFSLYPLGRFKRLSDTVVQVCRQHGQCTLGSEFSLLMAKPGDVLPMPVPDGMRLLPVNDEIAETVDRTWKYRSPGSDDLVKTYVKNFPSLALVTSTGCHVGHMIGNSKNCMGLLYIQPEFRGKGFAKTIVSNLAQMFFQRGENAYVIIDTSNVPSLQLHTSIGFQVVPDFTLVIAEYFPRKRIST